MIFNGIYRRLDAIERQMVALAIATSASQQSTPAQPPEALDAAGNKIVFKLDDAKMQDGIASIMGYDPYDKKRGEQL